MRNHIQLFLNVPNDDQSANFKRKFRNVSLESGIQQSRVECNDNRIADVAALGDVDNDGDMDIITSIYTHRTQNYTNFERTVYDTTIVNGEEVITDSTYWVIRDPGDRTELLLNDGNGNFSLFEDSGLNTVVFDESIEAGLTNVSSICFLDYNRDGNLDVFLGTWFTHYVGSSADKFMPNILLEGDGEGHFTKVGKVGVDEPLYGATVFDWNNDGWPDIATSSYCRTSSRLYMNMGGEFVDATQLSGYNTQRLGGDHGQNLCQWEAIPGDIDNDGDLDLLEVKVHGGYNQGEGRTTITVNGGLENDYLLDWDLSKIQRNAYSENHLGDMGGAFFDWDNDGDLDAAVGQDGYLNASQPGQVRLYFLEQGNDGIFRDRIENMGINQDLLESHSFEPADFDLDGDLDLFIASTHKETDIGYGEEKQISYKRIELLENTNESRYLEDPNYWIAIKPILGSGQVYPGTRITIFQNEKNITREIGQGGGHFGYQQPVTQYFGLGNNASIDSVKIEYSNGNSRVYDKIGVNLFYELNHDGTFVFNEQTKTISNKNDYDYSGYALAYHEKFGTVAVGESKDVTVYVTNINTDDNATLTLINGEFDLDDEGVFELISSNIPEQISNQDTAKIVVRFTPEIRTEYNLKFKLKANSHNFQNQNITFNIKGNGFEPQPIASSETDQVEFDNTWIGNSNIKSIEIMNTGELPLDISDIILDNNQDFTIDENITNKVVQPGDKLEINLTFQPQSLGDHSAILTINSNGYNSEKIEVELLGVCDGPLPEIDVVGLPLIKFSNLEIGEIQERIVRLQNPGNAPLEIYSFDISNNQEQQFRVSEQTPILIAKNETSNITIVFEPKSQTIYASDLTFDANIDNDELVKLSGEGLITSISELINGETLEIAIYPNPVNSTSKAYLKYDFNTPLLCNASIVDAFGRTHLKQEQFYLQNENVNLSFDFSSLIPGTYFLVVNSSKGNAQLKFIVN